MELSLHPSSSFIDWPSKYRPSYLLSPFTLFLTFCPTAFCLLGDDSPVDLGLFPGGWLCLRELECCWSTSKKYTSPLLERFCLGNYTRKGKEKGKMKEKGVHEFSHPSKINTQISPSYPIIRSASTAIWIKKRITENYQIIL